ncbi:hypothetical protein D3C76_1629830 [compost metagenome]
MLGTTCQFLAVAAAKSIEIQLSLLEGMAQLRGGRDIAVPALQRQLMPGATTRPEALHQNAGAILGSG